ncbi:hypothetical protein GQ53DRAFT_822784 [Thozetella sp. PMI_491]|nr:hypothetical protein GQ53DRAFT_822784 [Thozetella sp. PMI_491]
MHNSYLRQLLALLFGASTWVTLCNCQIDAPVAIAFRRRSLQMIGVLGNYLYIDGGEVSQYVSDREDTVISRPSNSTLSIPLDKSWTPSTAIFSTVSKGASRVVKQGALWTDPSSGLFYEWAGEGPYGNRIGANNSHIWKFTPDGKGGGLWAVAGNTPGGDVRGGTDGTSVVCGGTGFWLGGYGTASSDAAYSDDFPQPGLVSYSFSSGVWTNVSAPAPYSPHLHGDAVCLPFGPANHQGLVLFLGGSQMGVATTQVRNPVPLDNLTFYDPSSNVWYWQKTTGDAIPEARENHCVVGVAGPNGTYEIFLYGGVDGLLNSFGEVWVLSIPAFRWFRMLKDGEPRYCHKCVLAGGRHLISVGGFNNKLNEWTNPTVDPWPQGLGVFDLTTASWTHAYDPSAGAYDTPLVVKSWYANGSLQSVPWSSETVRDMFVNATSQTSTQPMSTNIGPIVGGIVGGVSVLALAGAVFIWYYRHLRKTKPVFTETESNLHELVAENQYRPKTYENSEAPRGNFLTFPQELSASSEYHEI